MLLEEVSIGLHFALSNFLSKITNNVRRLKKDIMGFSLLIPIRRDK